MSTNQQWENFKALEFFKHKVREETLVEIMEIAMNMKWDEVSSPDFPRDGNMEVAATAQDQGFERALTKLQRAIADKIKQ